MNPRVTGRGRSVGNVGQMIWWIAMELNSEGVMTWNRAFKSLS